MPQFVKQTLSDVRWLWCNCPENSPELNDPNLRLNRVQVWSAATWRASMRLLMPEPVWPVTFHLFNRCVLWKHKSNLWDYLKDIGFVCTCDLSKSDHASWLFNVDHRVIPKTYTFYLPVHMEHEKSGDLCTVITLPRFLRQAYLWLLLCTELRAFTVSESDLWMYWSSYIFFKFHIWILSYIAHLI